MPGGALRLTNNAQYVKGQVFYPTAIQFFNISNSSSSPEVSSFSTSFVFQIIPSANNERGGYGIAFTLSPTPDFPGADSGHYLGILNSTTDRSLSNHIFAVEFDTVKGLKDNAHLNGNNVGLNSNSMDSFASKPASYYTSDHINEHLDLESGNPIQAWIDYDGPNKTVNVTISPLNVSKPIKPLLQRPIDLTSVLKDKMYIGFSAATGERASSHYILGWSFRLNGAADSLDISSLPKLPKETKSSSFKPQIVALISSLTIIMFFLVGVLVSVVLYRRSMRFEISLEDWELDCPRRFRYKHLYEATNGFKKSGLIGAGGFGEVYKGVLPTTGVEVAVKRITSNNSLQGMREFAAEIESLGRLRHKHLVNLQGWCKKGNDLLLVYDYVPNGSLDSLLFNQKKGFLLNWEQRFNIIKGVAKGLLYLHEEWEQVVIHRDVKPSNVLIDAEMNARLGDFGLARLYNHGKNSHTTNCVGTIGYIAPELTRMGKASTSSDVFAFGVLLLEVACGRAAIVHEQKNGHVILVDWVIECHENGRILDSVDPNLNSDYVVEEVELVLGLGLLCSHSRLDARPTMREIIKYLNGDELNPVFDKLGSVNYKHRDETASKYLEMISIDISHGTSTTYRSSSIGAMSSTSLEDGR